MATFREVINRVLVSVGQYDDQVEDGATELTDAYHAKVAGWVNDVLEEVENAAQWRALRQRDTATISADALSGSLTNSNERSRVFRVHNPARGELVPLVFDVTDSSAQQQLREMDLAELLLLDQQNSNQSSGSPSHFALEPSAAGMTIYVWPRPDAEVSLEVDMVIPQSRLDTDEDGLDTIIKVPATLVVMGAEWWALSDRGEELGTNVDKSELRWRNRLSDEVAAEHAAQGLDDLVPV